MMLFRNHFFSRLSAIITGIVFLNLSFILTEVTYFELKEKNSTLYENIVRMVSGIGAEEEKDVAGEGESFNEKEVNIFRQDHLSLNADFFLITSGNYDTELNLKLLAGNFEINTPPPKHA